MFRPYLGAEIGSAIGQQSAEWKKWVPAFKAGLPDFRMPVSRATSLLPSFLPSATPLQRTCLRYVVKNNPKSEQNNWTCLLLSYVSRINGDTPKR